MSDTSEERAALVVGRYMQTEAGTAFLKEEIADAIRAAEAQARKAAFEEAAAHFDVMPTGKRGGQYHFKSGDIAIRIRALSDRAAAQGEEK